MPCAITGTRWPRSSRSRPRNWEAYHAGYFQPHRQQEPDYILPLSFLRELEKAGRVGRVHEHIYALPGVSTPVAGARSWAAPSRRISTRGVDGALLSPPEDLQSLRRNDREEIERVGIPVGMISAIYNFALTTGANRVVRGARIEHVCGTEPRTREGSCLRDAHRHDGARRAGDAVARPTLFDPLAPGPTREAVHASELGTFPVTEVPSGRAPAMTMAASRWTASRAGGGAEDPRIASAELAIARPGRVGAHLAGCATSSSRASSRGPGVCYPGICGRDIATVVRVVPTGSRAWPSSRSPRELARRGGDFVETYLDMSGHYGEMYPYGKLRNLCLVGGAGPALGDESRNYAVHKAALA